LERWVEYVERNDEALREIGEEAGRVADREACRAVARWGYGNGIASGARAWVRANVYEQVVPNYLGALT